MLIEALPSPHTRRKTLNAASKLYWLSIDVGISEITFRHSVAPRPGGAHRDAVVIERCVLHGSGRVANALTVGEKGADFDHFLVEIDSASETDQDPLQASAPSAKMIWSDVDSPAARVEIFIPAATFRHLVELYVTKRIDRVAMFLQIAVAGAPGPEPTPPPALFPLLDPAGRLSFRQTQCELLSVYTTLAGFDRRAT